jgi:hypothetical protein
MIGFGNNLSISFDGNHSFSFAGWFQITGVQPSGFIVSKGGEFVLGLNEGVLYAQLAGQVAQTTASFELDSDWHFLAVTFASSGSQGGTLTLYMDGAQAGQSVLNNVGTSNQGNPLKIGENLYINVWSLCAYTTALSPSAVIPTWQPVTSGSGLVASYGFMQAPPSDLSGNNNPISFSPGAVEQITTPGVNLQNIAYCSVSPLDGVNPGGSGNDAYTIQAWIYPEQAVGPQYVFSNGLVDTSAVSLYLTAGSSPGQLVLNAGHGSTVLSGGSVPLNVNTWSNVAVTYDGQTLTLFVNGQSVVNVASGSMTPVTQSNPLLGAGNQSAFPSTTGFFQGVIQSVDVWNVALSATQLTTYMLSEPYGQTGCLAIYTLSDSAINGITGSPVAFYNGAVLDALTIQVPTQIDQMYETAKQLKAATATPEALRSVPTSATGVVVEPLTDDQLKRAIEVFDEMFPTSLDAETRKTMREMFVSGITEANQAVASGKPLPGSITHRREGDDYVFYHHHAEGAEECLRLPAADVDQCKAWFVSIIATMIVGFLGVFSVPFTTSRVTAAVARLLNNTRIGQAIAQVLNEEVTSRTIIRAVVVIFTAGSLTSLISDILADLSWWDFFFVVGGVILQFIEIMFPNPSSALFYGLILVRMAAMVVQVNSIIMQKPTGC